jgi:hypothetical protein
MGHDMSDHSPPRLAGRLLGCVVAERDRAAIMGDLAEEYAIHLRLTSRASARQWYWRQVYRSMPPVLWSSARHGRWLSTFGIALGIYLVAGVIEFLADAALSWLIVPDARIDNVLSMIVGFLTLVLGGYLANWIRCGAANVLAAIVIVAVALLMVVMPDSVPLWYQLAFLILGPAASSAGGALFRSAQRTI